MSASPTADDVSDEGFARAIVLGALVGVPVTFILVFVAFLVVVHEPAAAPAFLWASLVGGGYFGGFVALNAALARLEGSERHETSQPARHQAQVPHAA